MKIQKGREWKLEAINGEVNRLIRILKQIDEYPNATGIGMDNQIYTYNHALASFNDLAVMISFAMGKAGIVNIDSGVNLNQSFTDIPVMWDVTLKLRYFNGSYKDFEVIKYSTEAASSCVDQLSRMVEWLKD